MDRRNHCSKPPALLCCMGDTMIFSLILHCWYRICNIGIIVNIENIIIDFARLSLEVEMETEKYMTEDEKIHGIGRTQIYAKFNFFDNNILCEFDGGSRICIILNKAIIRQYSCCFVVNLSVYGYKYYGILWRHQVQNRQWVEFNYHNVLILHHNAIKEFVQDEIIHHQRVQKKKITIPFSISIYTIDFNNYLKRGAYWDILCFD